MLCQEKDIKFLNIIVKASNKDIGNICWGLKTYSREHFFYWGTSSLLFIFPDICIIRYHLYVGAGRGGYYCKAYLFILWRLEWPEVGQQSPKAEVEVGSWTWGTVWESLSIFDPKTTQCQTTTLPWWETASLEKLNQRS